MRRKPILVGLFSLAFVIGIVLTADRAYWWIVTERVPHTFTRFGETLVGWRSVKRFTPEGEKPVSHGWSVYFFEDTGLRAGDSFHLDGEFLRGTNWDPDGRVSYQYRTRDDDGEECREERIAPPWWWDVRDQDAPVRALQGGTQR